MHLHGARWYRASTEREACCSWRSRIEHPGIADSDVRLQWDPDHDALGRAVERRAVQLGLRGNVLRRHGEREALSIEDITPFVVEQITNLDGNLGALRTPEEHVYVPNPVAAEAVGLDVP